MKKLSLIFLAFSCFLTLPAYSQAFLKRSTTFNLSGSCFSASFGDIDNDGDYDASVNCGTGINLWINAGSKTTPNFVLSSTDHGLSGTGSDLSFVDIDNDGDLDAFTVYAGAAIFYLNTGNKSSPSFVQQATNFGLSQIAGSLHFGDLDTDGDLDAVTVYGSSSQTKFYTNTGNKTAPNFSDAGTDYGINESASGIHLVDLDKDGDLDAFTVYASSANSRYWQNTGTSTSPAFIKQSNYGLSADAFGIHLVDIDDDADMDAFTVYGASGITFWENVSVANSVEKSIEERKLKIFPNPAILHATADLSEIGVNEGVLVVKDLAGREIIREAHVSDSKIQLNFNDFPSGIYFVGILANNQVIGVTKLLVLPLE